MATQTSQAETTQASQTKNDTNLGIVKIKETIIELDRLLEVYKSLDTKNVMKEYLSDSNGKTVLKDIIVEAMTEYYFLSTLAPQAACAMFEYLEKNGNDETNSAVISFYSRLSRGILNTNDSIRATIIEQVNNMVSSYMNSTAMRNQIKQRVNEALATVEIKTQVVARN